MSTNLSITIYITVIKIIRMIVTMTIIVKNYFQKIITIIIITIIRIIIIAIIVVFVANL